MGNGKVKTKCFSTDSFTLHPSPFTLHPSPFTLHPSPFTLHPSPFTLPPSPFTPPPFTVFTVPRLCSVTPSASATRSTSRLCSSVRRFTGGMECPQSTPSLAESTVLQTSAGAPNIHTRSTYLRTPSCRDWASFMLPASQAEKSSV